MNKRVSTAVVILIVTACLVCSGLAIVAALYFIPVSSRIVTTAIAPPNQTLAPTTGPGAPTSAASSPTPPANSSALPADTVRQMDAIQQNVIDIRGLTSTNPVVRDVLNADQLRQRVVDDFFKDYSKEEATNDVRSLSLFGLLKPNFDLYQLYVNLYSEQIAGFYDNKTKAMYVIGGTTFDGTQRMTYSHEYTHVLQDQHYDIRGKLNMTTAYCKEHSEYCAGVQALLEGDASLTEQIWMSLNSTAQDKTDITNFYKSYKSPVYDSAPEYLKSDFVFPYKQGTDFVSGVFQKGGWKAVDALYANPPDSTEQILHPALYPADQPVEIQLPDQSTTLGSGWKEIDHGVIGEWYANLILSAGIDPQTRLDQAVADAAAQGWGGDAYKVYWNDAAGKPALVWHSQWNTAKDADEFWASLKDYSQKRWGTPAAQTNNRLDWSAAPEGAVRLMRSGQNILLLIAPQTANLDAIQARLGEYK